MEIKTTVKARELNRIPAAVPSDILDLPPQDTLVNVQVKDPEYAVLVYSGNTPSGIPHLHHIRRKGPKNPVYHFPGFSIQRAHQN